MDNFAKLDELLKRKTQRFICVDSVWPELGPERHTAQLQHEVTPPLDNTELDNLKSQFSKIPQLIEFYSKYGSVRLYCDTVFYEPWGGYASAFYIAHPNEWGKLKEGFSDWFNDLNEKEQSELLPPWIDEYIVIGEIPSSGNYFLVPLDGSEVGSVYEFEHDGFEFIKKGGSLGEFITSICTVTRELINEISGHTRYFDGKTDTQWLAVRYEFD